MKVEKNLHTNLTAEQPIDISWKNLKKILSKKTIPKIFDQWMAPFKKNHSNWMSTHIKFNEVLKIEMIWCQARYRFSPFLH